MYSEIIYYYHKIKVFLYFIEFEEWLLCIEPSLIELLPM